MLVSGQSTLQCHEHIVSTPEVYSRQADTLQGVKMALFASVAPTAWSVVKNGGIARAPTKQYYLLHVFSHRVHPGWFGIVKLLQVVICVLIASNLKTNVRGVTSYFNNIHRKAHRQYQYGSM